jgi:hypothetical protein
MCFLDWLCCLGWLKAESAVYQKFSRRPVCAVHVFSCSEPSFNSPTMVICCDLLPARVANLKAQLLDHDDQDMIRASRPALQNQRYLHTPTQADGLQGHTTSADLCSPASQYEIAHIIALLEWMRVMPLGHSSGVIRAGENTPASCYDDWTASQHSYRALPGAEISLL